MNIPQINIVGEPQDALLLFADLVDSSKFSSILDAENYVKQLNEFQYSFRKIGESYFPSSADPMSSFVDVNSRGDEGTVFIWDPGQEPAVLISKAIYFSLELKAWMLNSGRNLTSPRKLGVGIGIHYGKVSLISNSQGELSRIEGFSINYAKRIESASRIGTSSRVFLSKNAAMHLDGYPIFLEKKYADLKGITTTDSVYEVKSALIESKLPNYISEDKYVESMLDFCTQNNPNDFIEDPWLQSFIFSVLKSARNEAIPSMKGKYEKKLEKLAWEQPNVDDPIILYLRARICEQEKKHTRYLSYLRELVEKYPEFVHARVLLVKACHSVAKKPQKRSEAIMARDIAEEFLHRFPEYLTVQETKEFNGIIRDMNKLLK